MSWNHCCPRCGNENIEPILGEEVNWINDDDAKLIEEWWCDKCRIFWLTHANIHVEDREVVEIAGEKVIA